MYELNEYNKSTQMNPSRIKSFDDVENLLDYFIDLEQNATEDDNDLFVFGKHKLSNNTRRGKNVLESTQFIVLTFDCTSPDVIIEALEEFEHLSFIYHELASNEDDFRVTIVAPLLQPISPADYTNKKVAYLLAEKLGMANKINEDFNHPAIQHYLPFSTTDSFEIATIINRGQTCLSVDDLLPPKPLGIRSRMRTRRPIEASDDVTPEPNEANLGQATLSPNGLFQKALYSELGTKLADTTMSSGNSNEELAKAASIVGDVFKGLLLFVDHKFYGYINGVWQIVGRDHIEHHLTVNYYQATQSVKSINNIIKALGVYTFKNSFPASEHDVIVLNNCALCLDPFEKLEHSHLHYAKNKLNFDYDEKATCPIWLGFLKSIWVQDQDYADKVALLQEFMGLSLTTDTKFHKMLWLIGEGSNGKSVIFDIVRNLVGQQNCSSVAFAAFGEKFSLEQLENKLVNIDPDMSATAMAADANIKKIVSGDMVTLERKHERAFQTQLVAKLWAGANFLPRTKDTSHGYFRRILILKFNRIIAEADQDRGLTQKLMGELPGIFNWTLEGLARLRANDAFTIPASSSQEVNNYNVSNNPVAMFKIAHLKEERMNGSPSKNGFLSQTVFEAFTSFCVAQKLEPVSMPEFGKKLGSLGIKSVKSNGRSYYPVSLCGMDI